MNPGQRRGPAYYASWPRAGEPSPGHGTNREDVRRRLVSSLLEHLVTVDRSPWPDRLSSGSAAGPQQVVRDSLGKPHLLLGEQRGPAISFSEGGGAVWAALCGDDSDLGIDVAEADEFQSDYPVHRVYNARELQQAVRLTDGDLARASALLWSVKEAVVKALGCGFHLVAPLDIVVQPAAEGDGAYSFVACLSRKALERWPRGAGGSIWVRALPQGRMWLSLAFLSRAAV